MVRRIAHRVVLPLSLLASLGPALAREPKWCEVRSPHFSVVTDAGQKRGRDIARHFEQMRMVFGTLLPNSKARLPVPLEIIAFRNTQEMRQVVPLWNGKPTRVSGLFQSASDRNFIMLDMSVDDPWEVVFHEYAHQLLNCNLAARLPPWFQEGFAEYFSTIQVHGTEAEVGLTPDRFTQVFARYKLLKVGDLFRVQQNSSTYNEEGDHRTLFYAESWLVVHYLYDKGWLPQISTYLELTGGHTTSAETAIQKALGIRAADLDDALQSYLEAPRKYYKVLTSSMNSRAYAARRLSALDARAVIADAHLHSRDYQSQAASEFREVLQAEPGNVAALRGLGLASLMSKDYPRARQYFDQALASDPGDSRVLYYNALIAQREGFSREPAKLTVLESNLERSIAADPDFADAYHILAWVQIALENYPQGLETLRKAVELDPHQDTYWFDLGEMYYLNHNYDQAISIWRQLTGSSNTFVAEHLAEAMASAQDARRLSSSPSQDPNQATTTPRK
jgi:tetratricopeptide (TPR) repeat protein